MQFLNVPLKSLIVFVEKSESEADNMDLKVIGLTLSGIRKPDRTVIKPNVLYCNRRF